MFLEISGFKKLNRNPIVQDYIGKTALNLNNLVKI